MKSFRFTPYIFLIYISRVSYLYTILFQNRQHQCPVKGIKCFLKASKCNERLPIEEELILHICYLSEQFVYMGVITCKSILIFTRTVIKFMQSLIAGFFQQLAGYWRVAMKGSPCSHVVVAGLWRPACPCCQAFSGWLPVSSSGLQPPSSFDACRWQPFCASSWLFW